MQKENTKDLEMVLQDTTLKEMHEITQSIDHVSFVSYINTLLYEKNLDKAKIIKATQIPRTYAYQILQGIRQPGRDKVIQLAIAMHLDIAQTNRLLTLASHSILYAKNRRDAILIFAIAHHYDLFLINELLDSYQHTLLTE